MAKPSRATSTCLLALGALTGCGVGVLESAQTLDPAADAVIADFDPAVSDAEPIDGPSPLGRSPDTQWLADSGAETDADARRTDTGASPRDAPDAAVTAPLDAAPVPPPVPPPDDCVRIRVTDTGGIGLNVRPDPSTDHEAIGNLGDGTVAQVLARVQGEVVRDNDLWYEIQRDDLRGFVTAVWAECLGPPEPPGPPGEFDDAYLLPFTCGDRYTITQGNNSQFSHNGRSRYAFDFSMPVGTPMLAMRSGEVVHLFAGTRPGDPCYDGGGRECVAEANYVVLLHDDGTRTEYAHLSRVDVALHTLVAQGEPVGRSGSTGWSTGPHAHVAREEACNASFCDTLRLVFADVPGDGVPRTGDRVTSGNGCAP